VPSQNKPYTEKRNISRRAEDRMTHDQIYRHEMLFDLGQMITSEMNLDALFELIIEQINQFMRTERCSLFLYDAQKDHLWSLVSTELKRNEIRIPSSYGVAGWVFQNKTPLISNDPYNDSRFLPDVDKITGFRTRNILCIPLINRKQECIGALQILNKKERDFIDQDLKLLTSASHYIAIALENAKLYDDLKVLDKAKERVINHLSHELKTPLSIISGVISRIRNKLKDDNLSGIDKTLDRGERNVKRLIDLQTKIDDILNQKSVEEKQRILDLIESAYGMIEEIMEEYDDQHLEFLRIISDRLEALFSMNDAHHREKIGVQELLDNLYNGAVSAMGARKLEIVRNVDNTLHLFTNRNALEKACEGFLKNAIENTPDEGLIEIIAKQDNAEKIEITVHDYGVGITPENQNMIFGGFFHTQDTMLYSSKRPYEFNAGGTGSDLLRIKVFSERFGFSVDYESTRCKFIPTDKDMCPGTISSCQFITDRSGCLSSGSSVFSIKFPVNSFER
jgi:signal transduction histidine kinase